MASKKRQKKSGTKKASRKHRGLSSWQKFMKSKKGQGLKVKQISKLYHAAGYGKKKGPKSHGKKAAKKAKKAKAKGESAPKSYVTQFKSRLVKIYQDRGYSLATAKQQASKTLATQLGGDAVDEQWQQEFDLKKSEIEQAAKVKAQAARDREIEKLAREGDEADEKAAAKMRREYDADQKRLIREGKVIAAQRAKLARDQERLATKAANMREGPAASPSVSPPVSPPVSPSVDTSVD